VSADKERKVIHFRGLGMEVKVPIMSGGRVSKKDRTLKERGEVDFKKQ